jgi:hypothetical protein
LPTITCFNVNQARIDCIALLAEIAYRIAEAFRASGECAIEAQRGADELVEVVDLRRRSGRSPKLVGAVALLSP